MSIQPAASFKVSLIGDDGIDEYHYGTVERISPEAPVPVFNHKYSASLPGMAANVRENLAALGVEVAYHAGLSCRKARFVDDRSKHHLLRVDHDVQSEPLALADIDMQADAVVVSDYGKGTVSYELIEELISGFDGPIFIDTKKPDLARFSAQNVYVKINAPEHQKATSDCQNLIVTRGSNPVRLYRYGELIGEYPVRKVQVFDVCGAGDTFLSALTFEFLASQDIEAAIRFASDAASVTVQRVGVYAPSLNEI